MPLTEEELDEVCQVVHPVLFRVGVLLGVSVAGIEKVLGEVDREPWGVARCVIEEFRMNCDQQDERLQLAKVLKKVNLGRVAVKLDPRVRDWEEDCMFKSDGSSLNTAELDHIAATVATDWERLADHLQIPRSQVRGLSTRHCPIYQKSFLVLYWSTLNHDSHCDRAALAMTLRKARFGRLADQISH